MKHLACMATLILLASLMAAQENRPAPSWEGLDFLIGEWSGGGGGQPGRGTGAFSFRSELNGTVLVRKSYAEYPATKDRPAFRHDDLMYMYHDPLDKSVKAIYFDNEGHVINYRVSVSADRQSVVCVSDAVESAPRYRLTYLKKGPKSVTLTFEIAPPGKPDSFTRYIEAAATKQ